MQTIYTRYKVDGKGKGKVVAKGEGKQRTVVYDHGKSRAANHGAVAGTLGDVLGWKRTDHIKWVDNGNDGYRFDNPNR